MGYTLRPYQQEAVNAVWNHIRTRDDNPCIVLPTGCHAKGHPILMYDGSVKKVEDIIVGDILMGPDSKPRRVLQLARGHEPMAKIIPNRGEEFVVNRNHILSLVSCYTDKSKYRKEDDDGCIYNISVNDYLQTSKKWKQGKLLYKVDLAQIPFRRFKHCPAQKVGGKDVLRTGFKIELLTDDDFYGFTIDGDHLYVDGNFFVMHNCGKSVVLGKIASDAVNLWNGRVLILAHVKELLEQNAAKIRSLVPEIKVGVYSAGLNSRDTKEQIIVAGIQSVYNKACKLDRFDLIIIDEVHMVPPDGEGQYQTFLKEEKVINPHVRLIGLTATPYRLKGGVICKPENLLNHVCYEAGLKEMILQGFLSPIVPKSGANVANFDKIHIKGGEFASDEVETIMNNKRLVDSACAEIAELTKDRKAVLIFGCSVKHCKAIKKTMEEITGEECAIVTGETPAAERAEIIDRFRGNSGRADLFGKCKPPLKYVTNMGVMTTGLDVPRIDCVAIMRPTMSPGLLVQMVGRGMRLSPEKSECLVLDYGGNIMRHGPLDAIHVEEHDGHKKKGEKPAKKCPQCNAVIETMRMACPYCGYVFPPRELKHDTQASTDGLLTGQMVDTEYDVRSVTYHKWVKKNAKEGTLPTVKVEYEIGFNKFQSEWLCPEHTGYAHDKFVNWWLEHRYDENVSVPQNVDETLEMANNGSLKFPVKITVRHIGGEKFDRVIKYEYGEPPENIEYEDEPHISDEDYEELLCSSPHDNMPLAIREFEDSDVPF